MLADWGMRVRLGGKAPWACARCLRSATVRAHAWADALQRAGHACNEITAAQAIASAKAALRYSDTGAMQVFSNRRRKWFDKPYSR